ncbi:NAD-dependent malic enzyme [Streptomyces griseoloalbus]
MPVREETQRERAERLAQERVEYAHVIVQAVRRHRRLAAVPGRPGHRRDRGDRQGDRPGFAGINLEDISAPRCFEIEARLREALDIPVFHDDQHGTAIVVLAALTNALRVTGKSIESIRVVMSGAGAAGTAILKLLLAAGVKNAVVADIQGVVHAGREDLVDAAPGSALRWIADNTNPENLTGTLKEAVRGADVFIGVSAPNVLGAEDVSAMAEGAIVFALANPDPEVDPAIARQTAAVVATGRSDFPNQINNVLVFPGVFRGLLDAQSRTVNTEMMLAAAPWPTSSPRTS